MEAIEKQKQECPSFQLNPGTVGSEGLGTRCSSPGRLRTSGGARDLYRDNLMVDL